MATMGGGEEGEQPVIQQHEQGKMAKASSQLVAQLKNDALTHSRARQWKSIAILILTALATNGAADWRPFASALFVDWFVVEPAIPWHHQWVHIQDCVRAPLLVANLQLTISQS